MFSISIPEKIILPLDKKGLFGYNILKEIRLREVYEMEENKNILDETEETEKIMLTDEDGVESEFELIGSAEIKGNQYFACVPTEGGDSEYLEYVILKLVVDEDGEEMLVTIDDDDEFEDVADYFDDALADEIDLDEKN
jgi:uncharacterized protein YrzB (UPF0473 family)